MKKPNLYKKIPSFWWDFEGKNKVIVESDHDKYPLVGRFYYDGNNAEFAINQAVKLVDDLNEGRISLSVAAGNVIHETFAKNLKIDRKKYIKDKY